jgi:hypothetical protein
MKRFDSRNTVPNPSVSLFGILLLALIVQPAYPQQSVDHSGAAVLSASIQAMREGKGPIPNSIVSIGTVTRKGSTTSTVQLEWSYRETATGPNFAITRTSPTGEVKSLSLSSAKTQYDSPERHQEFHRFTHNMQSPVQVPILVFSAALADGSTKIALIGEQTIGNVSCDHIVLQSDKSKVDRILSRQDWYIDSTTHIPLRVVYGLPNMNGAFVRLWATTMDFLNYQAASGVLIPYSLAVSGPGGLSIIKWSNIQVSITTP